MDEQCQDSSMDLGMILLADYANVDKAGKPNVMGIFSDISAGSFPVRHPVMYLVTSLRATTAEAGGTRKLTIKMLDEDGDEKLAWGPRDIQVPQFTGRRIEITHILRLTDVVFEKPGMYEFRVLVDNDDKGALPFMLEERNGP